MKRCVAPLAMVLWLLCLRDKEAAAGGITVGSKAFTESVVIGEVTTQWLRHQGVPATHRRQLGGTRLLWDALIAGAIDIYPEYTGTITHEILPGGEIGGTAPLAAALARHGINMIPLGYENNYALGMSMTRAQSLGVTRISDLRRFPGLLFGFSNEFIDRSDGWRGLRTSYHLPQEKVFGMEHNLAYRALAQGQIAVTDLYTTDPEIPYYRLQTLDDDQHYFPRYEAVLLYRDDLRINAPQAVRALGSLRGAFPQAAVTVMNERVKMEKVPEEAVAANFLAEHFAVRQDLKSDSLLSNLRRRTLEHLCLVLLSLAAAVLLAIPLGVASASFPALGHIILAVTGVIQTIPSLALLVFLIPLLGIGTLPVLVALFLYSLLPIVRNTFVGLRSIAPELRESAEALGLPWGARLRLVELPLASRDILAGVKTSAVINVGTATLGALIGAGGYGQPILTGIRLDDTGLILQGAIPAAVLALVIQGVFEAAERVVVPEGLRLERKEL